MEILKYFGLSTLIFSLSYIMYLLILRNTYNFKFQRVVLLSFVFISVLLPLSNYKISSDFFRKDQKLVSIIPVQTEIQMNEHDYFANSNYIHQKESISVQKIFPGFYEILSFIYISVLSLLILRMIIGITGIYKLFRESHKNKDGRFILVKHNGHSTFSFFNYIFISQALSESKNMKEILIHEKSHAEQIHTLDVLIAEVLSCIFWFNPLVWHFKNHLKLIHEYLADANVLRNGIEVKDYQTGLLNQISESAYKYMGSNYFFSIKKRFIMMSKVKNQKVGAFKYLSLLLIFVLLFMLVGYVNAQQKSVTESNDSNKVNLELISEFDYLDILRKEKRSNNEIEKPELENNTAIGKIENKEPKPKKPLISAMELPKMNLLYIGIENPLKIAVAGINNSKLDVSIDNGHITGANGEYNIIVSKPGQATVTIKYKGKILEQKEFRVRRIPDPKIDINSNPTYYSGKLIKDEILKWTNMNFVYSYLNLEIFETIFCNITIDLQNGEAIGYICRDSSIREEILNKFKELKSGDRIYFENMMVLVDNMIPIKYGSASFVID